MTLAQIDPNLFHLDWERTFEALAALVVLSIVVERALSIAFESAIWIRNDRLRDAREIIAFVASAAVCWYLKFDVLAIIILQDRTAWIGYLVTGAVVAGGSKGSIKLFRDVLKFKGKAYAQDEAIREVKKEAEKVVVRESAEAEARKALKAAEAAKKGGKAEGTA